MNYIEYHEKALVIYNSLEEGTIGIKTALKQIEQLNEEAQNHSIPATHTPTEAELQAFVDAVNLINDSGVKPDDGDTSYYDDNSLDDDEDDYYDEGSYEYDGSW